MRYLANKSFTGKLPGHPGVTYQVGDEVEGFGELPESVRARLLDQHYVVRAEGDETLTPKEVAQLRQMLRERRGSVPPRTELAAETLPEAPALAAQDGEPHPVPELLLDESPEDGALSDYLPPDLEPPKGRGKGRK